MWRLILAALLAVVPAFAQQKPGSVSGVVRDASTGALLSGVRVDSIRSGTITDSQGRFTLDEVSPGSQWVQAWDKNRGGYGGVYVTVIPGERATVEIRLKPGGSIAGRAVDEDHRPVTGALVILLGRRYENGKLAYFPVQSVPTGKDGAYRLGAISSGVPYLILVKRPLKSLPRSEDLPADPDKRDRVLMPSYYPNASVVAAAQAVKLTPGEVRTGADIRMASAPGYCIAGAVDGVGDVQNLAVTLTENLALGDGWSLSPATVKADPSHKFAACGLHPGEYQISAAVTPRDYSWSATAGVTITDRDAEDFKLLGRPAPSITGELTFDPQPREKPGALQLSMTRQVEYGGSGFVDSLEAPPNFNQYGGMGSGHRITAGPINLGRSSGDWQIRLGKLPAGCYLKTATYGAQDVLHGPLRTTEASGGEQLRLVVGCDGGSLTARVTDEKGEPVSHVFVYLMAAGASTEGELALSLRRAEVVDGWSAPLADLPSGKYLVLASELDVEPMGAAADKIEKLWQARSSAKEVEVGPGAIVQIALQPLTVD